MLIELLSCIFIDIFSMDLRFILLFTYLEPVCPASCPLWRKARTFSFLRMLLPALHSFFNYWRYFCSVQSPTAPVFYVLLLVFVIGSFYNTICINILLLFCLFTHSSIAVGPRIDALRPLEELIPGVLAASKAPSTVKGYHSQF